MTPRRTLMARRDDNLQARLDRDLAFLKLPEIAKSYREVLDEAARKGSSFSEVLAILFGLERTAREQRALERRLRKARLPKQKSLAEYDFKFPKRAPKTAIVRLFDCDFIPRHGCAVLIGPTGTGKTHLLTALGYTRRTSGSFKGASRPGKISLHNRFRGDPGQISRPGTGPRIVWLMMQLP